MLLIYKLIGFPKSSHTIVYIPWLLLRFHDLLIILYIQTYMEFSEGLTDVISDYWYSDFDHIISQYCGWSDYQ